MAGEIDYTQIGYDRSFKKIKQPSNNDDPYYLTNLYSTQDAIAQDSTVSQQLSASQMNGGILNSQGGNLSIDLNTGLFNYSDGVTNLLSMDPVNGLTINDSNGNAIVQTNTGVSPKTPI